MAKKKKQSAQKKELQRVKRFIRRAEKRGYEFEEEFKSGLSKMSWQKLRSYKPEKLYKQATFTETETGEVLTGLEGRQFERKRAAKKAVATRRMHEVEIQNEAEDEIYAEEGSFSYDFLVPTTGDIIMSELQYMIESAQGTKAAEYMRHVLDSNFGRYGADVMYRALEIAGESNILEQARVALYYETAVRYQEKPIRKFAELLNGYIMKASELKEMENAIEGF